MRNSLAIAPKSPWRNLHPFTYTVVLWCAFAFIIRNFTYKIAYMHPQGYPLQEMGWPYPMMRYEPWEGYIHWNWEAAYYGFIFLGWGLLAVGIVSELLMQLTTSLSRKFISKNKSDRFKMPQKKSWFNLHLSTAMLLMVTTGFILWANLRDHSQPSVQLNSGQFLYSYGWPCKAIFGPYEVCPAFFRRAPSTRWFTDVDNEFILYWLLPNGLTMLTILALTSVYAEVIIRFKRRNLLALKQ